MSRTDGTLKVSVFETKVEDTEMAACAYLLGQAAEWLRSEAIRTVPVSAKKTAKHEIFDLCFTLKLVSIHVGSGMDYEGDVAQLYVTYDDNIKGV